MGQDGQDQANKEYCLTPNHCQALHAVASAFHMNTSEFLANTEVTPSVAQARSFMESFLTNASEAQILAVFYIVKAITEKHSLPAPKTFDKE